MRRPMMPDVEAGMNITKNQRRNITKAKDLTGERGDRL